MGTKDDPINFIKLLKSEHMAIIDTVYEIDNQAGGPSNLKNSIEKLNKITGLLFSHLEKEDKYLYPTLINNKEAHTIGKKYFSDMERLSCIAVDFFKKYCVNREGRKILLDEFINSYSIFRGLLKVRIEREETELYPAYILLQSGVLYSDVIDYLEKQGAQINRNRKKIFVFGENITSLEAIALALEMAGYTVFPTQSFDRITSLLQTMKSDLILLDVSKANKEMRDLVMHIKEQTVCTTPLVGYSSSSDVKLEENIHHKFDHLINKPAVNIEAFSESIKQILHR